MTALPEVRGNLLPDHDSNRFAVEISPETDRALRELCQQSEITLNTIVAAAWGLWLARVQEEPRAIFGIMRGARKGTIPGAESIFGIFTNTLPIAVPIPDDVSVLDWLRDVRCELIALRPLEQNSLGEIAQWTGLDLGPDGPPSVLNFLRMKTVDILHAHGLPENRARVSLRQSVDVPLFISAHESPRLSLKFLSPRIGQRRDRPRGGARFERRALAIAAAPNGRLGEIDLLSTYDRVLLEKAERGPRVDVSGTKAHALIEREIREQPDGIAAVQGQYALTFRKFGEQAGSVARAIRESGLTSDVVAVILPPGPQILCAMLGILRAGAAFFLLNPLSPRLERERMLRRLSIGLAITDETNALDTSAAVPRVLEFEEILRAGLTSADKLPAIEIDGHDLAYLVHTSGSTGEKKFVEIEHRSLLNTIHALVPMYEMRRGDRRISRATPGNDYFLTETLVCLSGGGTLIFPERPGVMTVSEFSQTLRNERITVSGIPASYWHEWVRAMNDEPDVPPDLRLVISSMEKADPNLLAKWTRLTRGRVTWLNAYGPAETAIVSHIFRAGDETADSNNVPIGRLLPNMEAYILDRAQRKLPAGMTGEIAISGVGVARGYRGDDEVTRAKFVPNPHARSSEFSRLYLTGDYGYIDACGQFVFVGRRDEQVKIAGHRIELGEVETALQEYKEIRQTVVTAEGDGTGRRLVAHVLPDGAFDRKAMRDWMEQHLAPHLRPADFVTVEEIPVMPTGKIDRRALSAAYQARPRSPDESRVRHVEGTAGRLLVLWDELFGHRHLIGLSDSFFHLGGNSLLAVRLLVRIETEFGTKLSVHDLFTHPTIASLAALIDRTGAKNEFLSLIKLNDGGAGSPLFIVHGWSGGVFHCLEFARRLEGERPIFGLQAVELAGQPRHETVEQMARHYADELIRAHPGIVYELFGHSLGGMIAYATACELVRRGEKVGPLYVVDTLPGNLPRDVHVQRVRAELRPRLLPHLRVMLRTWPRYWPRYLRARRTSLESRLRKWPSLQNPERKPLRPDADYYHAVTSQVQTAAFLPST